MKGILMVKKHKLIEPSSPMFRTLEVVLRMCGAWEDERPAQEIVSELHRLRRSRSSEIQLSWRKKGK